MRDVLERPADAEHGLGTDIYREVSPALEPPLDFMDCMIRGDVEVPLGRRVQTGVAAGYNPNCAQKSQGRHAEGFPRFSAAVGQTQSCGRGRA